jgi:hypothetical protein
MHDAIDLVGHVVGRGAFLERRMVSIPAQHLALRIMRQGSARGFAWA